MGNGCIEQLGCLSVCLSVSLSVCEAVLSLIRLLDEWSFSNKTDHSHVHKTLVTLTRSLGQRSRSFNDGDDRNVMNSTAPGPLKECEPKLSGVTMGNRGRTSPGDTIQGVITE